LTVAGDVARAFFKEMIMTPLRQRMLDALVLRGMAARTQESYIGAVGLLARYYKRSPDTLSAQQVQDSSSILRCQWHTPAGAEHEWSTWRVPCRRIAHSQDAVAVSRTPRALQTL
jgi:hypothetical protein